MNRARQIRLDRGLTVSVVSTATGVAPRTIARIEDPATQDVQAPSLKALADFYEVPASSLLMPAVNPEGMAA
jgi:transcriptional regulator with XRE-family HTH domain